MRGSLWICVLLSQLVASQQIWDIYQTTWNRDRLFTSLKPAAPINFTTSGPSGTANIDVQDGQVFQQMDGFGASLTDSSAQLLSNLKARNIGNYWNILGYMFDITYGVDAAGLSYIRVPIGASDFSPTGQYSFADTAGDTSFNSFNINRAPSYLFEVLRDILSMNNRVKIHIVPWSPPGWMKTTNTMNGGSLRSDYVWAYPTYLLKAVQGFQNQGIPIYAISIQNEPQHSNPTYPTCTMTPQVEGQIGGGLRSLLNNNGLGGVKVIGYEHNWDTAGQYPIQLMQNNQNAFAGVAFHCYGGNVADQMSFHNAFPNKEVYFSECTGTIGSDWWSDIKWYMDNLWIGSVERFSRAGMMWNLALDASGNPKYPGTSSCGGPGCRPIVTIRSDNSYEYNQEFWTLAQASKAIIPKDKGGPFGQRIGVSVNGSLGWALRVSAFVTHRVPSTEWLRYSIVVLNWYDNASSGWNPTPVTATISFRGKQATYTFPVGVTTLWWFAPATGSFAGDDSTVNATTVPVNATTTPLNTTDTTTTPLNTTDTMPLDTTNTTDTTSIPLDTTDTTTAPLDTTEN